ncbi:uncharacterized protein BX664DRAFT_328152 [Halteromyces radiatus]|uniref:uncharacterized protein n=1 Tax=Halteromyces radiatus TaxID=101107 RepID=UPI0022206DE7|nr:uncharacterized protein BX664DRAFT_328152 [Halteromyces radiatus]KAI8092785.1 hypothetical protein BX664DRAFT_328152 [Halteromyces radiatus]
MDSSQCTLVILEPTQNYYSKLAYPYIDTLTSVFGEVISLEYDESYLDLQQQKYHHNTLFFMDLDMVQEPDDQVSVSSSSSSYTATLDCRLGWIKRLSQHFIQYPLIVCSMESSSTFMLDCLHAGATDFLRKPLYLPVIQTLFLKLHRRQGPESPTTSSTTSSTSNSTTTLEIATATKLHQDDYYFLPSIQPEDINHRFKEIVTKDIQLTKVMMDIYAPPLPFPTKYIPLSSRQADELKVKLKQWDFSPFEFNRDELIHCVYLIFEMTLTSPELSHLTVTQDQLYDFIIDLANAYHDDNPYHNFAHAVDVLQCIYYFLCQLEILSCRSSNGKNKMEPKHAFALLLSAIGHDAGHPGVNNMFLINSRTPLAVMYNDRSVLESLHSMTLFQLIKKHGLDQWWTGDDYQCFRQIIISSILATDMALNNDYVTKFKNAATTLQHQQTIDPMLLCTALIKCADVSNVTRPFRRGKEWAELLVEEFASQGDLERELGMPVQAANDRTKIILEECQIGFIRFVALDLFTSVSDLLPELSFTVQQMKQNLQQWEIEKANQKEKNQQSSNGLDILSTATNTTAGTKRRLSYCLEASTPPSLNTPLRRGNDTTNSPGFHYHHHYLNSSSSSPSKKKSMVDHSQSVSTDPISKSTTNTFSSSSSSYCILQ